MRAKDEERFTAFARAHSGTLFRTAYLMTGDYQRSEDLLQATLVRVYQHWSRVEVMERPVAYARKVLVNQANSWWRRRSSRELPSASVDDPSWSGHDDDVAEHDRVWRAVLSLPPRQRAVMVLRYYEDLSEFDIAEALGMAPGTVKSNAHAAQRRLAQLLGEPTVEPVEGGQP
jgi:RNA polymerase sigma-70 factor (sigma-E family)